MKKYLIVITTFLFLLLSTQNTNAEYIAIGDIEGNVCKGFVIEICGLERIDAEKGPDGKLYPIQSRYKDIGKFLPYEQGGNTGYCVIYDTKNWPTYQRQDDGSYKRIIADYSILRSR